MAPSIIVGVGVLASHQCFMSEKENLTTSWGRIFCSEILEGSLSCVPLLTMPGWQPVSLVNEVGIGGPISWSDVSFSEGEPIK